jgi:predicted AAA+ superfamily ATPase
MLVEKAILQQNKHWQEPYPGLIVRDKLETLVSKLSLKEIQIVLGIRRSGKSTLFKLLINHLIDKHDPQTILFINLDDPFFTEVYQDSSRLYQIVETAEKLSGKKVEYLFLDEIQNVHLWEKFVKSIYDSEVYKKIFITGSNSSLLKSEYAQSLSGRFILDEIFPFSYKEILNDRGIRSKMELINNKSTVLALVDTMLEYGAYPEVYKTGNPELKRELLINYYDTIVLKDCIANARIREVRVFKELTYYLLTNAGTLFSYNGLGKSVNTNENSAKEFINVLESSFLINEIRQFSFSLKKQSRARKKAYAIDNGILANVSFRFSANHGKLFENLVFSELKKSGNEIHFYQNNGECDFIVKKEMTTVAIQVCYELTDQNRKREVSGLQEAMRQLDIQEGIIITYDQEETSDHISIIPFWKHFA